MALSETQLQALRQVLSVLARFANRNGRPIGPLFQRLPDRSQNTDFYKRPPHLRRSLEMVERAIETNLYSTPSQAYLDLLVTFKGIEETVNRSSRLWRDATKMQGLLDEVWTQQRTLPPPEQLDPVIRPGSRDILPDPSEPGRGPYPIFRPVLPPHLVTDHLYANYVPSYAPPYYENAMPARGHMSTSPAPSPGMSGPPSLAQSPAASTNNAYSSASLRSGAHQQMYTSAAAAIGTKHIARMGSVPGQLSTAHLASPASAAAADGSQTTPDPPVELPLAFPASVYSKEAKQRLRKMQELIFANRARQMLPKKRKRFSDEVADPSSGWLEPRSTPAEQKQFFNQIIARLRAEKEASTGRSLSAAINTLPAADKFPQFYQVIKEPMPPTLQSVEKHVRYSHTVPDPSDFDAEIMTIFGNARIWPAAGLNSSDGEALPSFYGDVIALQRMYQEITKGSGLIVDASVAPASLATVPYGPGAIPLELKEDEDGNERYTYTLPGSRVISDDKMYFEHINFKGEQYAPGDFVHLYNPTNAKLPIVAQIFSCFSVKSDGQRYVTVNWFYRPSQTIHTAERTFLEQEVFKSSLFVDHKLEDIIERISVLYIDQYTKGRFDYWNEDMPLYVVEHRWNIETASFSRIKKWHRCVPEDAAPEPVSFRVFLDSVPTPPRVKSPFIRSSSIQGSGQQGEPLIKEDKEQNPYYTRLDGWAEGAGQVVGYHRIMSRKRLSEPVLPPPDSVETLPVAAPRTRGSQGSGNKRAKEDAPATQLLELAEQESFDPLPAEIRDQFGNGDAISQAGAGLLWFAAPPLAHDDGALSKAVPSLEYLSSMAKQLGY